jgi:superfamily II DNA or RNA helicase
MTVHDVIDNREEKLSDHVGRLLAHSESARFAVGYFFLSGFETIKEQWAGLKELRLLIGNTSTAETIEQLSEGYQRLDLVNEAADRIRHPRRSRQQEMVDDTRGNVRRSLELMDQTNAQEGLITTLAGLIEEERVKVRVYTKGRLHSKAYIFDYPEGQQYERGVAIVGSSNLTLAGLSDPTELNVVLHGEANHAHLTAWFDELWEEAQDFDEPLLHELRLSWAMNPVRPYDIYIKTLYHLVKDRLEGEERAELLWEKDMPELADFQKVAVRQAIRMAQDYGGVFVADVVGLGKTYIGMAMLRHFYETQGARPLIICPASLLDWWEESREDFGVDARVLSMGLLQERGVDLLRDRKYRDRDPVLIDESHNFRYNNTQRYRALQPYLLGKTAILLTATPRNNTEWDIYHQIKLFHHADRTDIPIQPPDLRSFFKEVEAGQRRLDELLRFLLIRRPRSHIKKYYPKSTINGKPIRFPDRELENIEYSIEETYEGAAVYSRLRELMGDLDYCKYGLGDYVVPSKRSVDPYLDLQTAGRNLRGLMRIMLFKRFESSVEAFRRSLERLVDLHQNFLRALDEGIVPAGEEAQRLLYESDIDDEIQLSEQLGELRELSSKYSIEDFNVPGLQFGIDHDLGLLREMLKLVEPIGPEQDDKLQALKSRLRAKPVKGQKVLIFSQYADTTEYLYQNLKDEFPQVAEVDSTTKNRRTIMGRFAPIANRYRMKKREEPITILITTDVLSEGQNLQDCNIVINYDLHWNPVRLIQRIGRIDRLASEHETVWAYNFLPESELERQLGLHEKLRRRIQEIHDTIGEDAPILDKTERLNPEAMYAIYTGDMEALEGLEEEQELFGFNEAEELIRQLEAEKPEYLELVKNLPDGVRSAKASQDAKGAFVFCQAGGYQELYLTPPDGELQATDIARAVDAIKCDPDEETKRVPRAHNRLASEARRQFDEEVKARLAQRDYTHRLRVGQTYAVQHLRLAFQKADTPDDKELINLLDRIVRQPLSEPVITELNKIRRAGVSGEPLIERLQELVSRYKLTRLLEQPEEPEEPAEPSRIICSEALV